ncbi:phage baseplate assembly protein V [Streptomyces phaeochromogenes]|uniref:phage baseplate assembly protein V n=1 Tax=Streptomyces phaeochromogenes TaxID=1923 RepID=UPI0006E445B9|nr:phage baseplate assembly protein V [Streptomyces phaeochromogenes]
MAAPSNRYLGKFRGRVIDNNDPLHIGRITVEVPDVLGDEPSTWALPCLPFTGPEAGQFVVPPPGAGVWVEFEQGDPSFPVWTGCWYGDRSELPPDARRLVQPASQAKPVVVQTPGAHKIVMSDPPGADQGILLQAKGGAYIRITEEAVVIATGAGAEVLLRGDQVTINEGQLTVLSKR